MDERARPDWGRNRMPIMAALKSVPGRFDWSDFGFGQAAEVVNQVVQLLVDGVDLALGPQRARAPHLLRRKIPGRTLAVLQRSRLHSFVPAVRYPLSLHYPARHLCSLYGRGL